MKVAQHLVALWAGLLATSVLAAEPQVTEGFVNAPVAEVWKIFTTSEGFTRTGAAHGCGCPIVLLDPRHELAKGCMRCLHNAIFFAQVLLQCPLGGVFRSAFGAFREMIFDGTCLPLAQRAVHMPRDQVPDLAVQCPLLRFELVPHDQAPLASWDSAALSLRRA